MQNGLLVITLISSNHRIVIKIKQPLAKFNIDYSHKFSKKQSDVQPLHSEIFPLFLI